LKDISMKQLTAIALALVCAAGSASAQTIERVKMTDNDLSCQQVFNEITQMDAMIARANQPVAAAAPAQDAGNSGAGSAIAGAVAQQAIGQAAARGGFGGFGGGFGGMLGGVLGAAQNNTAQQQQQAAAQQAAAQQQQQNSLIGQQAQGRKEHLTGVFLAKGCKMSEIQR
jgi:hypothetical protein